MAQVAFTAQMVVDYLYTLPEVDKPHIAVTGYSRWGKMAAITAMVEERITACVAGSTGVGGLLSCGKAFLRVAISGTNVRAIDVAVNDQPTGQITLGMADSTFAWGMGNGIQGLWYEREVAFDATMLKSGTNVMKLTVPAGPVNAGVMYDYLRLELDESSQ